MKFSLQVTSHSCVVFVTGVSNRRVCLCLHVTWPCRQHFVSFCRQGKMQRQEHNEIHLKSNTSQQHVYFRLHGISQPTFDPDPSLRIL